MRFVGQSVQRVEDRRLLTGSTSEHAGFAKQVTAGGIGAILANAQEISPAIANLPIVDTWAGLRPKPKHKRKRKRRGRRR